MTIWGYSKYIRVQDTEPRRKCPGCQWIDITTEVLASVNEAYSTQQVGTSEAGVTETSAGDGKHFVTTLEFPTGVTDAFTVADLASLAVGYQVWTFPAGAIHVSAVHMDIGLQATSTEIQTDTPEVGVGSVVASGAVSTLAGTPAFDEYVKAVTATDVNGTPTVKTNVPPTSGRIIESADAHEVFLNIADAWADDTSGDLTVDITAGSKIVIEWTLMS